MAVAQHYFSKPTSSAMLAAAIASSWSMATVDAWANAAPTSPLLPVSEARAWPAQSGALNAADAKAVRQVIQAQLQAFAADDAAKAYSFAAPNVREATGSPGHFLAMVRSSYPVVYRPASVAFLNAEGLGNEAVQRVQMQDAAGDSWLAVYSLQRQKSRVWRITGCVVLENKGRMA